MNLTARSPLKDRSPTGAREPIEIVGVDPSVLTGIARIRVLVDGRINVLDLRSIEFPKFDKSSAVRAALEIFDQVAMLAEFVDGALASPVAIEHPYFARDPGHYGCQMLLVGGLEALLLQRGIRTVPVQPQRAKHALTACPHATKADMIREAKLLPHAAEKLDWRRTKHREAQADAIGVCLAAAQILRKGALN